MNGKIINNFEPYIMRLKVYNDKDIYYGNCWYGAFMTVANAFGRDVTSIINNAIYIYLFNEERVNSFGYFFIRATDARDLRGLLPELGIMAKTSFPDPETVHEEIRKSIDAGYPVAICIDLFYQPGRNAYYQKRHGGGHMLLIYGYDTDENLYYTVDDVIGLNKYTLTFEQLYLAYKGNFDFCDFKFGEAELFFNFTIGPIPDTSNSDEKSSLNPHLREFARNMLEGKEKMMSSLKCIDQFADVYERVSKSDDIIQLLSFIINGKMAEHYRLLYLKELGLEHEDLQSRINSLYTEIVGDWNKVRISTAQTLFTDKEKKDRNTNVVDIIKGIYQKENRCYELVFELVEKFR